MDRRLQNSMSDLLMHGWEVHPTVIAGCIGLLLWYFLDGPLPAKRWIAFTAGVAILCLALISPIDPLGDQYLFSAHMFQHLLLILIVPPLIILGLTPERVGVWMTVPSVHAIERVLATPWIAWTSNMFMMSIWHIPALYNAANANTAIHILEHMTFLVTACMFWWPILSPIQEQRLAPPKAMVYLFGAAAVSTVLGIVITFLPVGLYHPYLHPAGELGALHLIRVTWGISAVDDERLAGLLMWVPGCSVYFVGLLMEMARWYNMKDPDKLALLASLKPSGSAATHE
jgi:putative membrane protein